MKDKKKKCYIADCMAALILAAIPFIHVNTGVALSDPLYNIGNFERFPNFNQTWMISTYLSNVVGKFFTLLPGGHTMLGMSIWCSLIVGLLTACVYLLVRRFFDVLPSFAGVLIGVVLCWCPRVILYHYLTYLLFDIAALVLLIALTKEKKYLCVAAGVILALNTFVRFPNVAEVSLIVVVFAYGIIYRKHIYKEFALCFAGYTATFLAGFALINLIYGKGSYISMINGLFAMTDKASGYKPASMLIESAMSYVGNLKWFMIFMLLAVLGVVAYGFARKRLFRILIVIAEAIGFVALLRILVFYGIIWIDYTLYSAIYAVAMFLVFIAFIIWVVSLCIKSVPKELKLMGVAVMAIVAVTPLGSNNGFYSVLNNMFTVSAYVVGMMFKTGFIERFRNELIKKDSGNAQVFKISPLPAMGIVLAISLTALFQGMIFSSVFVFRDAPFYSKEYITISDDSPLRGMRTTESRYESLCELKEYFENNEDLQNGVIPYGGITGVPYFLKTDCRISHSWPDLDSYPTAEFKEELNAISDNPPIVLSVQFVPLLNEENPSDKINVLKEYMNLNGYEPVFNNDEFAVYSVR